MAFSSILSWFPGYLSSGLLSYLHGFFFFLSVTFREDLPAIHIDVPTLQPEVTPSPWKRLSLDVAPVPVP